ncbi:MAG: tRNA pseudouridine(55) synthase TruB [Candidatus Caenarcaniphilales bacterium]|jgi:tRNA pseudouridine55 synthase|nr:tRNA pseudouridine(55) synthase TruB [Candidatus Caenarcaniphilales bacterium]
MDYCGFLNIDKPVDWTSHDVVARLRRLLNYKQIGHAGTLDPFATGVLPIAVGSATRLIRFLKKSKKYFGQIDLSFTTDTDDLTGQSLKARQQMISKEELETKLNAMQGNFEQYPPLYSAKKVNGKKLYELMREGQPLDLTDIKPKLVNISAINLLSFDYPKAEIEVICSEGTYIRSIARDVGGHLTVLRRLESNGFEIHSAFRFEDLDDEELTIEDLISAPTDFLDLPKIHCDTKQEQKLQQGQNVFIDSFPDQINNDLETFTACLNENEELIGLAQVLFKGRDFELRPKIML